MMEHQWQVLAGEFTTGYGRGKNSQPKGDGGYIGAAGRRILPLQKTKTILEGGFRLVFSTIRNDILKLIADLIFKTMIRVK